ncbi:hypothetical protein [Mycolicibacterium setense]|uniref:hypothetical protein n=1 Tax=Mycolicibacterium setense TaxID=431269 RepID=UPI0012FF426E|nr:hypothetical protein [Mycolicibacterium setense]MCV7114119.1 hypothetical protein [Mycolicibacterium setense]
MNDRDEIHAQNDEVAAEAVAGVAPELTGLTVTRGGGDQPQRADTRCAPQTPR